MPSPASPTRRDSKDSTPSTPRSTPRHSRSPPRHSHSHRHGHSHTPRSSPSRDVKISTRPSTFRRHTTQGIQPHATRPLAALPVENPRYRSIPRRTHSSPAPVPDRDGKHVFIPVPVRARDAQSPLYVRAPSGQRVDFIFSPPKKQNLLSRLLGKIEWDNKSSQAGAPYQYRKPSKPTSRPFYKKILP